MEASTLWWGCQGQERLNLASKCNRKHLYLVGGSVFDFLHALNLICCSRLLSTSCKNPASGLNHQWTLLNFLRQTNSTSQLLLCNGPGTCLPVIILARLLSIISPCTIVYVESVCRVTSLSLTARWETQCYLCFNNVIHFQIGITLGGQDPSTMAWTSPILSKYNIYRKIFVMVVIFCDT